MHKHSLIPPQTHGKQVDLAEEKAFPDPTSASAAFQRAAHRLLHPRQWKELSGSASASFEAIDQQLEVLDRSIAEGDYIRIDIPGPGPGSGNGYDWVKVELVESSGHHLGVKLMPCANPEDEQEQAAHFFSKTSSSTLTLDMDGLTLIASYHGRNETANNETGNVGENIRNTLIAAGAMAGLSEIQWKKLLQGLME